MTRTRATTRARPRGSWRRRSPPSRPTRSARIKRLATETPKLSAAEGLALEAELQKELIGSPNQIAAVGAAMSKQPAAFTDPT